MAIKIEKLPAALGARVMGIDLGQPVGAADLAAITQAWLDHIVLIFPEQDITQDQQLAFAGYFGDTGARARKVDDRPEGSELHEGIMLVTNDKDGDG
ncbi:MAG: TauD/TfdA family dioxygenase, partial [Rhodospirillales bacterium]|nr:TauD/TfdA family dioxygenase [Rhodospirillales bacterium]